MSLRVAVLMMKIFPFIPYRKTSKGKQKTGIVYLEKKTLAGGTSDCMDAKKVPKTCCQMGTKN
ncbi:MAG TPA: hypothetical protein VGJ00_03850 [Rhabdochlamydiaceae bacterium]